MDTEETQEPEKIQEPEKAQEPTQNQPKREEKFNWLDAIHNGWQRTKTAFKIGLAILTLGTSYYIYRQLKRSPEQVKEDGERIRKEEIPQKYPNSPVRKEMADLGSRVGEWTLTGEYPSKSPEEIKKEAEEIREEIKTKETGVNGLLKGKGQEEAANAGSKFAEWIKGGRQ